MRPEEIKDYWNNRAASDRSVQATTNDIYMRYIEVGVLIKAIEKYKPSLVADIGCGDGRTTLRLAQSFPMVTFSGIDFAPNMIEIAKSFPRLLNLFFKEGDVCKPFNALFNMVYSTRCLINLPSWDMQQQALFNIRESLLEGGIYVMIENFIEGHDKMNEMRHDFGLPEIPVRQHNLFFDRKRLKEHIAPWKELWPLWEILEEVNISSSYYMMTRGVYARMCQIEGTKPDYADDHHVLASKLPFAGEYGPVRMIIMRRK